MNSRVGCCVFILSLIDSTLHTMNFHSKLKFLCTLRLANLERDWNISHWVQWQSLGKYTSWYCWINALRLNRDDFLTCCDNFYTQDRHENRATSSCYFIKRKQKESERDWKNVLCDNFPIFIAIVDKFLQLISFFE